MPLTLQVGVFTGAMLKRNLITAGFPFPSDK